MSKKAVTISLSSRQTDGEQAEETVQTHQGLWYDRDGASYLVYNEDGLSTTLRVADEEVRVYRRGSVTGWQVFQLGELTGGLVTLGQNEMLLRVMTSHMRVEQAPESGQLQLGYELFTGEDSSPEADLMALSLGKFQLSLSWTVAAELPPEAEG